VLNRVSACGKGLGIFRRRHELGPDRIGHRLVNNAIDLPLGGRIERLDQPDKYLQTGKRFSTNRRHKAKKVQVRALCGADRSGYGTADRREDAEAINVVRVVNSMII